MDQPAQPRTHSGGFTRWSQDPTKYFPVNALGRHVGSGSDHRATNVMLPFKDPSRRTLILADIASPVKECEHRWWAPLRNPGVSTPSNQINVTTLASVDVEV